MWISFHEQLLMVDNLANRGIHISILCMLCEVNLKTVGHIFIHYPFTL